MLPVLHRISSKMWGEKSGKLELLGSGERQVGGSSSAPVLLPKVVCPLSRSLSMYELSCQGITRSWVADLAILWNKNTVCIECRISGEILYATALYVLEVTQVKISCHGWMTYDNTATGDQSRILAPALPFFGEPPWFVAPTDWAL